MRSWILGTRYGIVTPYTSYLALEEGAVSRQNMDRLTPATAAPGREQVRAVGFRQFSAERRVRRQSAAGRYCDRGEQAIATKQERARATGSLGAQRRSALTQCGESEARRSI